MLSALHEPKINKQRVSNYVKYESTVDMTGINYPVETKQIPFFEKSSLFHGKPQGLREVQVGNGFSRTQGVRRVVGENVLLGLREKNLRKKPRA